MFNKYWTSGMPNDMRLSFKDCLFILEITSFFDWTEATLCGEMIFKEKESCGKRYMEIYSPDIKEFEQIETSIKTICLSDADEDMRAFVIKSKKEIVDREVNFHHFGEDVRKNLMEKPAWLYAKTNKEAYKLIMRSRKSHPLKCVPNKSRFLQSFEQLTREVSDDNIDKTINKTSSFLQKNYLEVETNKEKQVHFSSLTGKNPENNSLNLQTKAAEFEEEEKVELGIVTTQHPTLFKQNVKMNRVDHFDSKGGDDILDGGRNISTNDSFYEISPNINFAGLFQQLRREEMVLKTIKYKLVKKKIKLLEDHLLVFKNK